MRKRRSIIASSQRAEAPLMRAPALLAFGLLAWPTLHAADLPPPGQYRIDAETTTTSRAGPTTIESVQRVDGATGRITLTQKSSVAPANVATRTVNGEGPNGWCVPASGTVPPPKAVPSACQNMARNATPGGSTLRAECNIGQLDEQWRRIDARAWERSLMVRQTPGASNSANASPQAAIELAMRGMTPEQRARAQAELANLPTATNRADARGTLIAVLEQQTRTGSPEEAAAARQQLSAMGASPSGSGGDESGVVVRIKELWTRVAENCRAPGG
jgi:hypothetical protein